MIDKRYFFRTMPDRVDFTNLYGRGSVRRETVDHVMMMMMSDGVITAYDEVSSDERKTLVNVGILQELRPGTFTTGVFFDKFKMMYCK